MAELSKRNAAFYGMRCVRDIRRYLANAAEAREKGWSVLDTYLNYAVWEARKAFRCADAYIHGGIRLDGIEVRARVRDGRLTVEVDTFRDGAPEIHGPDGVARVEVVTRTWDRQPD